ncbi:MAG: cell wall hydrolase [Pseudomonadota bacterium]
MTQRSRFLQAALLGLALGVGLTGCSGPREEPVAALPEPEQAPPQQTDADKQAIACLAQAAYFEARGEGEAGMRAVVHVVLNRTKSRYYPATECAVIRQGGPTAPCQFSWYCDGRSDVPRNKKSYAKAVAIAEAARAGNSADPTGGADMFHSRAVDPYWAQVAVQTAVIGRHIFYQLN